LSYEQQFANVSSSDNNECGQIPDSIIYSGGFDSDEVKGSSKADSSDSDEVKGSSKADSSDSDSEECFTYNWHSKNEEKSYLVWDQENKKNHFFPVLMRMINLVMNVWLRLVIGPMRESAFWVWSQSSVNIQEDVLSLSIIFVPFNGPVRIMLMKGGLQHCAGNIT
jgi:hypothetical protein